MKKTITIKEFNEITVKEFQKINEILKEPDSVTQSYRLISYLSGLSSEEISKLKINDMLKISSTIADVFTQKVQPELIKSKEYALTDYSTMTFGHFVDLMTACKGGLELAQYQLCVIYRYSESITDLDLREFDSFKYINYVAAYNTAATYINALMQEYKTLTVSDVSNVRKNNIDSFYDKWGWYITIAKLCNNDITKINEVTKLHHKEALTFLAYQKDVDAIT